MDVGKLLELASKLNVPGLFAEGVDFIAKVKANADRAKDVLSDGDRDELDAIHVEALAAADSLDAKLADAERR